MEINLDRRLVDKRIFRRSTSTVPARVRKNSLNAGGRAQPRLGASKGAESLSPVEAWNCLRPPSK